jgi:hypothetical protein
VLVSGECSRWGWVRARFAFLEVHAFNETVRDGKNVPYLAIRKDIATKAFHELMNFNVGNAAFLVDYLKRFHVRITLLPLKGPVGPNLFFPDDTPAFRCLGPANVLTHERQGPVDIPLIEGHRSDPRQLAPAAPIAWQAKAKRDRSHTPSVLIARPARRSDNVICHSHPPRSET